MRADTPGPIVRLRDVRVSRPSAGFTLRVDDLDVEPGTTLLVSGASGSGKSTLLDVMAGLVAADAGTVEVAGLDLRRRRDRARVRRRGLYLAQHGSTVEWLTAAENVLLAGAVAGLPRRPDRAHEALAAVGLEALADRRDPTLSGGQRQRVGVAAALYRRAPVVWADEPTSALDPDAARVVYAALRALAREQSSAVILVSHDADTAAEYADRHLRVGAGPEATGSEVRAA